MHRGIYLPSSKSYHFRQYQKKISAYSVVIYYHYHYEFSVLIYNIIIVIRTIVCGRFL